MIIVTDVSARFYFVCCRNGKYKGNVKSRKTSKKRTHQKETRKIGYTCISRMYVDEFKDGQIAVRYVSAHTGHELGPDELKHLPLPRSTKEEISVKMSMGVPAERLLKGIYKYSEGYTLMGRRTFSLLYQILSELQL